MSISPLLFDKVKQKLDVFLIGTIGGIVEFCSGSFILVLNEENYLSFDRGQVYIKICMMARQFLFYFKIN